MHLGVLWSRSWRRLLMALGVLPLIGSLAPRLASQDPRPTVPRHAVRITFFDVGQADAILISTPEGRHILVDGGRDSRVVQYLLEEAVDSLDVVIASHGHADHIVGLEAVFQSMPVGLFIDGGGTVPTLAFHELREARRLANVPYLTARDTVLSVGSVRLHIIPSPLAGRTSENNRSVVVRVEFGKFSVLLPGDAELEEIQALVGRGLRPVTVLKAAHHGARNGLTPGWLVALRPEAVVISVGSGNAYGHPDPWALKYYSADGRRVYRTDLHGAVTVWADSTGDFNVATKFSGRR